MSLIDRQSSPGFRSTTAALFQIKMSVCIVSLPVTKGPPQHTNRCFWKVLLGYRPAWRWNPLLYCFSCSCTARTLCPTYCACCAVLQCVWPLVSINFPCVSASFWMFSRTINAVLFVSCKAGVSRKLSSMILCDKAPFLWWVLRSQSCCHTSESLPADTSGCAQRIDSVCRMFNYALIDTHRCSTTWEWMEMSADIGLMVGAVVPGNGCVKVSHLVLTLLFGEKGCRS